MQKVLANGHNFRTLLGGYGGPIAINQCDSMGPVNSLFLSPSSTLCNHFSRVSVYFSLPVFNGKLHREWSRLDNDRKHFSHILPRYIVYGCRHLEIGTWGLAGWPTYDHSVYFFFLLLLNSTYQWDGGPSRFISWCAFPASNLHSIKLMIEYGCGY